MDAGTAFQVIALLALGAGGYAFFARERYHAEEKRRRVTYYRRILSDVLNAGRHFEAQQGKLAGLLEMDEIAQRQALEDAKFASRGLVTYELSDAHRITEAEAERLLALTVELKAADSTIEAAQEAAMAGSNTLPALHEDLMRRVERISAASSALARRVKPKAADHYWSN